MRSFRAESPESQNILYHSRSMTRLLPWMINRRANRPGEERYRWLCGSPTKSVTGDRANLLGFAGCCRLSTADNDPTLHDVAATLRHEYCIRPWSGSPIRNWNRHKRRIVQSLRIPVRRLIYLQKFQ
jgi:hypothetical protein